MANLLQDRLPPAQVSIQLRPYTVKELSALYGICVRTFNKWLMPFRQEIGKPNGRFYTIPQVRIIFNVLEFPTVMYERGSL